MEQQIQGKPTQCKVKYLFIFFCFSLKQVLLLNNAFLGYGTNFGIIPRTLDYLFNRLEDRIYQKANIKPNQFDAHCEIDDATIKIHDINKNRLIGDSRIVSLK